MLRNLFLLRSAYMLLFVGVIAVNGAANALPINGLTTGAVSDLYPNLFTPAGFAFSIWGLIYLGLLAFLIRILMTSDTALLRKLFPWFAINCLANMAWIFAWHHLQVVISLALMLVLLMSLIKLTEQLRSCTRSSKETRFFNAVFEVYLGWITVATVANFTALLVSFNWNALGISEEHWMLIILPVIVVIAIFMYSKHTTAVYLLPIIWAFYGIHVKHVGVFQGQFSLVITAVTLSIAALILSIIIKNRDRIQLLKR
jgi:hypothetical protein